MGVERSSRFYWPFLILYIVGSAYLSVDAPMRTHQASSFSIISALTNSSINSWSTIAFLPAGTGRLIYMNVSYVVDVLRLAKIFEKTYLVTRETFQTIPILTLKQIDNETIVPLSIDLPFLL